MLINAGDEILRFIPPSLRFGRQAVANFLSDRIERRYWAPSEKGFIMRFFVACSTSLPWRGSYFRACFYLIFTLKYKFTAGLIGAK